MKKAFFAFSVFILFTASSCRKNNITALTDYIQLNRNGLTTYYTVTKAYWQEVDTGKLSGKYYYITAYQAFTDSLNYITLEFRDNISPLNKFCPSSGLYGDLNAPSSGCMDSAKNCMGFTMSCYFSEQLYQYNTTADSVLPVTQSNIFSCDNTFQQVSGTFQTRLSSSGGVIQITGGQFNDVVFANQ